MSRRQNWRALATAGLLLVPLVTVSAGARIYRERLLLAVLAEVVS